MKDEKKVKLTEEEVKKEVQTEEEGVQLTDEQLKQVTGGEKNNWDNMEKPWGHCFTNKLR